MRKAPQIRMIQSKTAVDAFDDFLRTKRADGVKTKTLDTYSQHFHAISKHLSIDRDLDEITSADLQKMIVSMQESGLAPNSIKSYTITRKAFFSWCNAEGLTMLNLPQYKGEETIKETYSDAELSFQEPAGESRLSPL